MLFFRKAAHEESVTISRSEYEHLRQQAEEAQCFHGMGDVVDAASQILANAKRVNAASTQRFAEVSHVAEAGVRLL